MKYYNLLIFICFLGLLSCDTPNRGGGSKEAKSQSSVSLESKERSVERGVVESQVFSFDADANGNLAWNAVFCFIPGCDPKVGILQFTEGSNSLEVDTNIQAWNEVISVPMQSLQLGTLSEQLLLDVYVPDNTQTPGWWAGALQLHVNIPSIGIYQFVEQKDLTQLNFDQFNTLAFTVPAYLDALLSGPHNDVQFRLTLLSIQGSGSYFFDNLRFDIEDVGSGNQPPVANAGEDQMVSIGSQVTLDGSLSSDPEGEPLSFQWTLVSAPAGSNTSLANADQAITSFIGDQYGDYILSLVVNDGEESSPPDQVMVSVINVPPIANAGVDQNGTVGESITLDASASQDIDNDPLQFQWTFLNEPEGSQTTFNDASLAQPQFTLDIPGTYEIQLTVTAGSHSAQDTVLVEASVIVGVQLAASADWDARAEHSSVVFDERVWILGGLDEDAAFLNDVWFSSNGQQWTQSTNTIPWETRSEHSSVVFDSKIWLLGGLNDLAAFNDVWSSSDGIEWTQETSSAAWSARSSHSSVVYQNKLWVLGGNDGGLLNDVWSSDDGVTWTQELAQAPWSAREDHSSIVFDNQIWVIGGNTSNGRVAEVWSSSDGVTWTQSTATAPWGARSEHTSVVFNEQMWVSGGITDGFASLGDLWYSIDGSEWIQATVGSNWPTRFEHASVTFNESLLLMGGDSTTLEGSALEVRSANTLSSSKASSLPLSPLSNLLAGANSITTNSVFSYATDATILIADAGSNQTVVIGDGVTLDGSNSQNFGGGVLLFQWAITSRPANSQVILSGPDTATPSFTPDLIGDYELTLTVSDASTATNFDIVTVSVLGDFQSTWVNSGGVSVSSPKNPIYSFSVNTTTPIYMDLISDLVGTSLMLVDEQGQLIAVDNQTHEASSKLTLSLEPGTYSIIAGTLLSGSQAPINLQINAQNIQFLNVPLHRPGGIDLIHQNMRWDNGRWDVEQWPDPNDEGNLSAEASIAPAINESDVTEYVMYWGSSPLERLSSEPALLSYPKTGQPFQHSFASIQIPNEATHLLIFSKNADGEIQIPLSVPLFNSFSSEAIFPTQIAAGDAHTCALFNRGTIKCWGSNEFGQLGHTIQSDVLPPVGVEGITTAISIAAGFQHTCAVLLDGSVQCWGNGEEGRLGNGSNAPSFVPVTVPGITNALRVTAGWAHTCALLNDQTVQCWGDGSSGQLGHGANTIETSPVAVNNLSQVTQVSAGGFHTCALLNSGQVQCWGSGVDGQLGNGQFQNQNEPVMVTGISNATQLAAGGTHNCATLADQSTECWGLGISGQLGNGGLQSQATPVLVDTQSSTSQVTSGWLHSCAVAEGRTVECWGYGALSQLANMTSENQNTPQPIVLAGRSDQIAAGQLHNCSLLEDRNIWCWGYGANGQLGNGSVANQSQPIRVTGLEQEGLSGQLTAHLMSWDVGRWDLDTWDQ